MHYYAAMPKPSKPLTTAQQALVTENLGLAFDALRRVHMPIDSESKQIAFLGLCIAAQSFEPERGFRFSTWGSKRIRWFLLDFIERSARHARRYVTMEIDAVDDDAIPVDRQVDITRALRKIRAVRGCRHDSHAPAPRV